MAALQRTDWQQSGWHFPSRSGGSGHDVQIKTAADGSQYLTCTCPGGRFAFAGKPADPQRGQGCWAMKAVRQIVGI